jgi:Initiation factor 2 subunit family
MGMRTVRCTSSLIRSRRRRAQVVELLNELIEELELAEDAVIARATEHIHANEVVLTLGLSETTLQFLLKAAERRTFQARRRHVALACNTSTAGDAFALLSARSKPPQPLRALRHTAPTRSSFSAQ